MFAEIDNLIRQCAVTKISADRKLVLQALINYIQNQKDQNLSIRLNFICTHNSRRSHLSQIWAQTMAHHFGIRNIFCFSGGTEATAIFPKIIDTLVVQGFQIQKISLGENPIYAIKYANNEMPIIGFSKTYDHIFNPQQKFAAIMTCDSADEACPIVIGAEARFPIKYADPKVFDGTMQMDKKYAEKSLEIAQEMWYIFSMIN
jgi:arsenate reductase (thioredoxin)